MFGVRLGWYGCPPILLPFPCHLSGMNNNLISHFLPHSRS